jgi:hypothetical protein
MVITQLIFAIQELNFNRQRGAGAGLWMPGTGCPGQDIGQQNGHSAYGTGLTAE